MQIDWLVVATIAGPLLGAIVGAPLVRMLERRPNVITWLGHASAVQITPAQGGPAFWVYTHAVVIRNAGKMSATNVRLGHNHLPNFSVYPNVSYQVSPLPAGGSEIVFLTLVPNEQITITYLYYPPTTWDQINAYTKSDQGIARSITVLPTPAQPMWVLRIAAVVLFLGAVATLYLVYLFGRWLWMIRS